MTKADELSGAERLRQQVLAHLLRRGFGPNGSWASVSSVTNALGRRPHEVLVVCKELYDDKWIELNEDLDTAAWVAALAGDDTLDQRYAIRATRSARDERRAAQASVRSGWALFVSIVALLASVAKLLFDINC